MCLGIHIRVCMLLSTVDCQCQGLIYFLSALMHKCFPGAVGEYFATVLPKELWVALRMGRLCSHLAVGGSGSAVLACAVIASPSQH